jgi:uncharacterized protein (DUF4415 family)
MAKKPERIVRVTVEEARQMSDLTDFAALDAMTDEDIAKAVAEDPDAAPLDIEWTKARLVLPPGKESVTLRVDKDVLDWFRKQGRGYQTQMNAVLRDYQEAHQQKEESKMLVNRLTQQEIVELAIKDPHQKSWEIMKELRQRGRTVPPRRIVQLIRSTAILCRKSPPTTK